MLPDEMRMRSFMTRIIIIMMVITMIMIMIKMIIRIVVIMSMIIMILITGAASWRTRVVALTHLPQYK